MPGNYEALTIICREDLSKPAFAKFEQLVSEHKTATDALRYCEFHMVETHWPKDHPMLLAVRKALGSPASGRDEHG